MNTKLYKRVHQLAIELLKAADAENEANFDSHYQELRSICDDNAADEHRNHPVQWETLADFTEDADEALAIYQQALELAEKRDAVDYQASISFSMAQLLHELKRNDDAFAAANKAKSLCESITDNELLREIHALLKALTKEHKAKQAR